MYMINLTNLTCANNSNYTIRVLQVLRNADGGGGVRFYGKKRYEGVRFNVICVTRGWVGVQFPQKNVT